nr:MAG TPA: hypothetical protein [Caudoviricetes sp.]
MLYLTLNRSETPRPDFFGAFLHYFPKRPDQHQTRFHKTDRLPHGRRTIRRAARSRRPGLLIPEYDSALYAPAPLPAGLFRTCSIRDEVSYFTFPGGVQLHKEERAARAQLAHKTTVFSSIRSSSVNFQRITPNQL